MTTIKKRHVVCLNMRGASRMPGVVKWVGKDGRGENHAVVQFDNGALLLTTTNHLTVQVIPLSAEQRIERGERTT